jgi:arginase family enzyme
MGPRHGPSRRREPDGPVDPDLLPGEKPHFAGINTFLKAPYVENVRDVGKYDAAILGVPFDGGATFRPGTRFGPQGELAWKDTDAVYISFDIDAIDCGFVPGTGWPEPGGFLPREALRILGLVAAEGVCGLEMVEVSPPYDTADITSLMGTRIIVDTLGSLVAHGKLGSHKQLIDRPVSY